MGCEKSTSEFTVNGVHRDNLAKGEEVKLVKTCQVTQKTEEFKIKLERPIYYDGGGGYHQISQDSRLTVEFTPDGGTSSISSGSGTTAAPVQFGNLNSGAVSSNPTQPTVLTFTTPVKIVSITNYHWNSGKGTASTGTITLKHSDGTVYGPWSTSGTSGQGGVPNANWVAAPQVTIKAGTYTVIDSDPSTWAQNTQSGHTGMTFGTYIPVVTTTTSGSTGVTTIKTTTTTKTTPTTAPPVSGTTTNSHCSGSGTSIYVDDRTMNPGQDVVIPIMICNANDLANMDLSVTYNTNALLFRNAVKGSLNSNTLFESNKAGNTIKIAFAGKSGFTGSGSIALLTFNVAGLSGASSPITVSVTEASTSGGKTVSIPVNNGKISIGNSNANDPGGRGKATSLDALIALQISVGKLSNDSNYDVTDDGKVNSSDAREILKLAVQ
ncbi:MAG: hypothetical protein Q7T80_12975 [Methanoregula sp.]|nr:hypothetical protein [Methanoregula sp.]